MLSSKLCKKCKKKRKEGAKVIWSKDGKSVKLKIEELLLDSDLNNKNAVFKGTFERKKLLYKSENLKKLNIEQVISSISSEDLQINFFGESSSVKALATLFIKGKLRRETFKELTQFQMELITLLISKRMPKGNKLNNESEFVEFPISRRRTEENIKFIFNRAIKFMMQSFKEKFFSQLKNKLKPKYLEMSTKEQLKYAFFGFYFGEESVRLKTPIDQFILPKKYSQGGSISKNCFSSISKQYLQLVTVNPNFLNDLRYYLTNYFMHEMINDTIKKCQIILSKCQKKVFKQKEFDREEFVRDLEVIIKKTHMPWNIFELRIAIEDLISYLRL